MIDVIFTFPTLSIALMKRSPEKFEAGVNTVGNKLQVVLLSSEYWSVDGVETSDAKVVIVQPDGKH